MPHSREMSGEWLLEPDFHGRPATSSGAKMFFGAGGGSETHRLSARGVAAAAHGLTLDIPGHNSNNNNAKGYEGGHGAASHLAPSTYHPALETTKQHLRSPTKPGGFRRTLSGSVVSGSGRLGPGANKKVWRHRLKLWIRVAVVLLLIYVFGRTVYQLKFFVKAALLRYWVHPLDTHRPVPCGIATPPTNPLLANLDGDGVVDGSGVVGGGGARVGGGVESVAAAASEREFPPLSMRSSAIGASDGSGASGGSGASDGSGASGGSGGSVGVSKSTTTRHLSTVQPDGRGLGWMEADAAAERWVEEVEKDAETGTSGAVAGAASGAGAGAGAGAGWSRRRLFSSHKVKIGGGSGGGGLGAGVVGSGGSTEGGGFGGGGGGVGGGGSGESSDGGQGGTLQSSESSSHAGRAGYPGLGVRGGQGGFGWLGGGGAASSRGGGRGSKGTQHMHPRTISRAGDIIPAHARVPPIQVGEAGGFVHRDPIIPLPQPLPELFKPGAAAASARGKQPEGGGGGEGVGVELGLGKREEELEEGSTKKKKKKDAKFAILTLCDANAGYICTASVANKRRYAALHGYDLIVSTEVADPTRPAAWSKILEVRKHLPSYDWLLFIDVDTLVMNPGVRLEDIADDGVDQVIAADHNGVNSGVWLVRHSSWMMWFLDELWAQEHLVKGSYLFHYEQRAFHHLFQTQPWARQKSVRGTEPYGGAAQVRAHSKIVNQCVFNSLLPWYVTGDFVVHLAGLKGVWECVIFWHYFGISQEREGMRVTDEQWAREVGVNGGKWRPGASKAATLWRCFKFKTLF